MSSFERQFIGDNRFRVHTFPEGAVSMANLYFVSTVAAERVLHTIEWPAVVAMPVGASGATREVNCCSLAIVYGEMGSSHWIFGHIESGRAFPDLLPLQ